MYDKRKGSVSCQGQTLKCIYFLLSLRKFSHCFQSLLLLNIFFCSPYGLVPLLIKNSRKKVKDRLPLWCYTELKVSGDINTYLVYLVKHRFFKGIYIWKRDRQRPLSAGKVCTWAQWPGMDKVKTRSFIWATDRYESPYTLGHLLLLFPSH